MNGRRPGRGIPAYASVTVAKPIAEVYRYIREFERAASLLPGVERAVPDASGTFRWTLEAGPAELRFETTVVFEEVARRVEWMTLAGGDLWVEGGLRLNQAPGGRGTEVHLHLQWEPAVAAARRPARLVRPLRRSHLAGWLARMKQDIEAGEVAVNTARGESPAPPERPAAQAQSRKDGADDAEGGR